MTKKAWFPRIALVVGLLILIGSIIQIGGRATFFWPAILLGVFIGICLGGAISKIEHLAAQKQTSNIVQNPANIWIPTSLSLLALIGICYSISAIFLMYTLFFTWSAFHIIAFFIIQTKK